MRRFPLIAACAILVPLASARPATAQEGHAVTEGQLDRLIESRTIETERDRDALRRFLNREDVQGVAAEAGLDLERAKDGIATLDDDEVGRLAERVEETETALADNTIVISSTAIIIALLVLILILVAD